MRNLLYLLLLLVSVGCRAPLSSPTVQPRFYPISDKLAEDQAGTQVQSMVSTIAPYKAQLDAKMNRQLATVKTPLKKASPESNLGNWMADLMAAAARDLAPGKTIAFATANQGGLRVNEIGTGPLLVSEIYELMPFDNELVLMDLSGAEVTELLAHIANQGGWPVSEAVAVSAAASGLKITLSGLPVDAKATYTVAMPDYIANGGSNSSMVKGKPYQKTGVLIRDLLIDYAARSSGPIDVNVTGKRMNIK